LHNCARARTGARHRRLAPACFVAVACLALLARAASAPPASTAQSEPPLRPHTARFEYLAVAENGIADARRHWWNHRRGWYNNRLKPDPPCPLATIWGAVGLFEAIDGVAIARPTERHRDAVRSFAHFAERYWTKNVAPYGAYAAYPGDGDRAAFFDDNGWWGLAFVDAYRATHDIRYLEDAAKAMRFIDVRGWDGTRGMWWNTWMPRHSLETYASATALAAELYDYSGQSWLRKIVRRYIAWGDRHAVNARGLYATSKAPAISYVQGAMIGAHLALCRQGDRAACARAENLAQASSNKWNVPGGYQAPQYDTILFRYLIQLSDYDHDPRWYDWAQKAARDASKHAREHGLFLKFWDGTPITAHGGGAGQFRYGMLHTHGAAVALFAWLAAAERPSGNAVRTEAIGPPG
jgi:hypothetical protein